MEVLLLGRWGGVVAALIWRSLVGRIIVVVFAPVAAPVEDSGAFGVGQATVSGRVAAIDITCAGRVETEAHFAPIVSEGEATVERRSVRALACAAGVTEVGAA